MTKNQGKNERVDLALLDSLPVESSGGLVVERAWLPLVIWDGVRVTVRSTEGITLMERFVIECLLTLVRCRHEELREIASIPKELSSWIFSSLLQKGLAEQEGEWFIANVHACTEAIAHRCVAVEREERRAFMWFPDTHEVVVLKEAVSILKELRNIHPTGRYPLPNEWQRTTRAAIIRDVRKHGHFQGEDNSAIVDVLDEEAFEAKDCPAYHCRATLLNGGTGWSLTVCGIRKRKHRTDRESGGETGRDEERIERVLSLPFLPKMAKTWRDRLTRAGDSVTSQMNEWLGAMTIAGEERELLCSVREDAARAIASERLLVNRLGLLVRLNGDIEYSVALQLQPGRTDQVTQKIFAVDSVVQRILAARNTLDITETACTEAGVTMPHVMERLWELKLFHTVYDLRETADFSI